MEAGCEDLVEDVNSSAGQCEEQLDQSFNSSGELPHSEFVLYTVDQPLMKHSLECSVPPAGL